MRARPITFILIAASLSSFTSPVCAQPAWRRISSKHGDLPVPFPGTQQTASLVADLDGDGRADFLMSDRTSSPSLVWYRASAGGFSRYVIEHVRLSIEAGGAALDVDGDGDLDIVFGGDSSSNGIWWWENPAPKFQPETGWQRHSIKNSGANKHHDQMAADLDGDGKKELITYNQGAKSLLWYRLPADPRDTTSWKPVNIHKWESGEMEGLAACDINGDGKLDLVGGGRWFEYLGGEAFQPHVIDETVPFSRAVCGQLKKGGAPEVAFVVGDGVGRLRWYELQSGKWIAQDLLGHDVIHGHTLELGDVDGDGNMDLFCAEMGKWIHTTAQPSNAHAKAWVFYGNGQGKFQRSLVSLGYGIHEGRLADFNGDGRLDILAKPYHWDAPRIDILLNEGSGKKTNVLPLDRWRRQVVDSEKPWRALFIDAADLDGDGRRDIVAGGWWYKNLGGGSWERKLFGNPFHNFLSFFDVDTDGRPDLLASQGKGSEKNGNFVWAQNLGGGRFHIHANLPAAEGDFAQGVATLPGQGSPLQIALSYHQAGKGLQLLSPPASGSRVDRAVWTIRKASEFSQDEQLSASDIDRDGRVDLLAGTWWFRNEGNGSFTRYVLNEAAGDPDRNRLGDMNGDGRLDAVVGYESINKPGKLAWYEQGENAKGSWIEHPIAEVVGPMSLDVADMDGDGDLDVVVGEHNYAKPETAALWIFENSDGKGLVWKQHLVHRGDEHHDGARVVDIDDDGDLDIVSLGWSHGRVLLYENLAIQRRQ